ncbi:hypothetical protein BKH46_07285 [Helicobacter sp. 12S02634-8]|uniref:hypothetical protein n=1 Tax=Helicobacter sp. 12S02634-8 TaxID=1476199 RepID=UPI000BA6A452|nr:hypothetical protein [Helicobacter sp. 12S02634-8]PAF46538.1 hypothetical protein BKH46_07285 [Helicobacter sp. 12S02634-8]
MAHIEISQTPKNEPFIRCVGKVKTDDEFLEFKEKIRPTIQALKNTNGDKTIFIFLIDSYPISLPMIGYLLKLKENDGLDLKLYTNSIKLFGFFQTLELNEKIEISIKNL